jgi:hypothetical protein
MKLQSYIKKIDTKEVVTCVLLIVVGYMTARLFIRKYSGFRVGGQNSCPLGSDLSCKLGTYPQRRGGGAPSPDPCSKVKADDCNKSWWQSKSNGAENKPIGIACKYVNDKCITPGTGFKNINGCPTKSCDGSPSPPGPPSDSKISYNCNASKCVSVSGTSGTYSSESDCQSKCGKPSPSPSPSSNKISCSYTGSFDTGVCYLNKKIVDPTDSKYNAECIGCQWYSRGWFWGTIGISIIISAIISIIQFNFNNGVSYGIIFFIVFNIIYIPVDYYVNGTLTTNKTQN